MRHEGHNDWPCHNVTYDIDEINDTTEPMLLFRWPVLSLIHRLSYIQMPPGILGYNQRS